MVSWFAEHRQTVLITLAITAVVLPLLLGMALGQIPKQLFVGGAIPLAAATFVLAVGISLLNRYFSPFTKLVVSLVFGLLWILAGIQMLRLERRHEADHPEAVRGRKIISLLFILFGIAFSAVAIYRHLR
ncbi:MAG: hypothetical protein V1495_09130 [Pseudomonadota bacterium]